MTGQDSDEWSLSDHLAAERSDAEKVVAEVRESVIFSLGKVRYLIRENNIAYPEAGPSPMKCP